MTAASNSDARKREAERAEQAASVQKSAIGAPNSPEVAGDASGAVGAILSTEEQEALSASIDITPEDERAILSAARSCDPDTLLVVVEAIYAARFIKALREHRAEVLADVERRIDGAYRAYLSSSGLSPNWIAGWHSSNLHAAHVVREYRKEQNR
jgi:hypothetical protein